MGIAVKKFHHSEQFRPYIQEIGAMRRAKKQIPIAAYVQELIHVDKFNKREVAKLLRINQTEVESETKRQVLMIASR